MSEAIQALARKLSEHIQVVESARPGIYGNSSDYVWDCAEGKAASAHLLWTTIIHMQIALMLAAQPRHLTDKVDFDFARLCRTGQAELKRAEEDLKVICPELTSRREPPNFVRPAASAAHRVMRNEAMTSDEQEQEAKAWVYGLATVSAAETGAMWESIGLAMAQAGTVRSLQLFGVRPAPKQ